MYSSYDVNGRTSESITAMIQRHINQSLTIVAQEQYIFLREYDVILKPPRAAVTLYLVALEVKVPETYSV